MKKPVKKSHRADCFPPIATRQSRALILGSMPGVKSLEARQYYAHPQNLFWRIMGEVFSLPVETYGQRVALIEDSGLALWDVLRSCDRQGSLDTDIDDKTIEVNDFMDFFKKYPRITRVFFNGMKAEKEFMRRVLPLLPESIAARLSFERLPSTSPANAGMPKRNKTKAWNVLSQLSS